MATKEKPKKPSPAVRVQTVSAHAEDVLRVIHGARVALEQATADLAAARREARFAYVTIEGVYREDVGAPADDLLTLGVLDASLERKRMLRVAWLKPYAVTKRVLIPHADTRTTVRFEPFRRIRVDLVRIIGAGVLDGVRCGRVSPLPCDGYEGQAVQLIGHVIGVGEVVQVDVKAVP